MKSKMAKIVKPVVFLLLAIAIFFVVQEIFIPSASRKDGNEDRVIDGIKQIEPDTVDVIFMGTSLVGFGVSPIHLYEKTGICGYSFASGGQPMGASYWLLKDALRRQSPSVVFLQTSNMYEQGQADANPSWRYIMDNYRLSPFKFEMARDYDTIPNSEGWLSALFPMIKYHTRWNALTEGGLSIPYGGEYYSLGEWVFSRVEKSNTTMEDINGNANLLQQETYITERSGGGKAQTEAVEQAYNPPWITDDAVRNFLRIKELCDENDAELVLFQIPTLRLPKQGGAWTKAQSDEIHELARMNGVAFYDLQYDTDIGLNWATDTCDAGTHLNFKGAEKVTDALGAYLLEHFPVRRQSNPQYDAYAARYDKIREVAMLQSETDLPEYLNRLEQKKDQWSVFVVACDEYTAGMKAEAYDRFEDLGLPLIKEGRFKDAYLAILDRGKTEYEAVSGGRIDYETEINGMSVKMSSAGRDVSGYCAVALNNIGCVQRASNEPGLSIVVYDNESGLMIDNVRFDTSVAANAVYRDYWNVVGKYLRDYEAKVCF